MNETGTLGIFLTQSIVQKTGNLEVKPGANTPETQFFPLQKIKCFVFFRINTLARKGTSPRAHTRGDSVFARENVPRGLFEGAGHVILSHSCF